MKPIALLIALMSVAGSAHAVAPAEDKLQFLGAIDLYLAGDIDDDVVDAYNQAIDALGNATNEVSTSQGIGARIGIRKPCSQGRFDIGTSLSYVKGPEIEAQLVDNTVSPAAVTDETIETEFIRLMLEAGARFAMTESAYFRLGAGIGFGQSKVEDEITGATTFSGDESDTGFAWELSPSFVFGAGKVDVEIGLRYAQFPKISKGNNSTEVDWRPFGFFAGVAF